MAGVTNCTVNRPSPADGSVTLLVIVTFNGATIQVGDVDRLYTSMTTTAAVSYRVSIWALACSLTGKKESSLCPVGSGQEALPHSA